MRVRASVIAATKQFKATGFPPADNPGLIVSALIDGSAAKTVNQYFSKSGKLPSDCAGAGLAVLQKGLLNVVGNNLFNFASRTADGGSEILNATKEDLTDNMWLGDMVQLPNYDDWENYHPNPQTWAWRGENVIKTGDDKFWGYVGSENYTVKSKQEWNDLLREAFNSLNGPKREGNIPALSQKQTIFFPDIAAIAMKLFDVRSKNV